MKKAIQGAALWSGKRRGRKMVDGEYVRSIKWPLNIERELMAQVRAAAAREGVTLSLWIGDAIRRRIKGGAR
jgi:hypothetical protein